MSAKTTELKPCPFFGSGNVRYKEAEHAVVCARCKARGSIAPDEEMAIRMWDERAGELKPDSWERLEEDVEQFEDGGTACEYFGSELTSCNGCKSPCSIGSNCRNSVARDVLRRAKKLAGIEEEAQR